MPSSPQRVSVDLTHFGDPDDPALPAPVRKNAIHFGEIAACASASPAGRVVTTPLPCPKRPQRRPCPGMLAVVRQEVPPLIRFECAVCGYGGQVAGWQGSVWDLGALGSQRARAADRDRLQIPIPRPWFSALRQVARDGKRLRGLAYTARFEDEEVWIEVPGDGFDELAQELLGAAAAVSSDTQRGRLASLMDVLQRVAEGGMEALVGQRQAVALRRVPDRSRRPARSAEDPRTFRLKVTLHEVRPPVWRRLLVPAGITLAELHEVLQIAMGWCDCHLHAFRAGDRDYAPPPPDGAWEPVGEDSTGLRLCDLANRVGGRLIYEYDFGDGWTHDLQIEEIRDEPCEQVVCVKGKRACPPEDCGGPYGYMSLLDTLADPEAEDHAEMLEWVGGRLDPDAFDLEQVNGALASR